MPSIAKISLLASALAASANAGKNAHAHLHHQRHASQSDCGTVTSTTTIWVEPTSSPPAGTCGVVTTTTTIYGPEPVSSTSATWSAPSTSSAAPTTSSSVSSATSSYVASTSSSQVLSTSTSSSSTVSAAATSYAAANNWSPLSALGGLLQPKPSHAASNGNSATISPNGNKWAMTYTPYNSDGSCKTADEVNSDIANIASKGFTAVRLYATDCSGPENVGAAAKANGMNILLGIYIDNSGIGAKTDEQISTLTSWGSQGNWGMVEMVVAGNEAIFNNYVSASALAGFISDVKSKFQAAGYGGLVTTTEPLGTIQDNGAALCPVVDVISANIHPFFNGAVGAVGAGLFVSSSLNDLSAVCNHEKDAYNLETGWPTQGHNNGDAIPGVSDQKLAIDSIMALAGQKSVFFSYANDMWKAPGSLDVEQFWGCADVF